MVQYVVVFFSSEMVVVVDVVAAILYRNFSGIRYNLKHSIGRIPQSFRRQGSLFIGLEAIPEYNNVVIVDIYIATVVVVTFFIVLFISSQIGYSRAQVLVIMT